MLSAFKLISAASTNSTSVKPTPTRYYNAQLYNAAASVRFVKLYDKAVAPTVGTDIPKITYAIPAGMNSTVDVPNGVAFTQGLALAITAAMADSDSTAVAASDVLVNLQFT